MHLTILYQYSKCTGKNKEPDSKLGNIIIFKFCSQSKRHNALSRYLINSIFYTFPPDLSNLKQKIQKY